MKKFLLSVVISAALFSSCSKQNEAPTTAVNETVDTMTSTVLNTGAFTNGPYGTVSGSAKIVVENGNYILALQNMVISNGPDLHVYISKEMQPINFIDLGKLKSTNGNQLYTITGNPDFKTYKYALIHCQQYNHLFGSASLQ